MNGFVIALGASVVSVTDEAMEVAYNIGKV